MSETGFRVWRCDICGAAGQGAHAGLLAHIDTPGHERKEHAALFAEAKDAVNRLRRFERDHPKLNAYLLDGRGTKS